ncbi:MAG: DUF4286 family protein [Bacteroidales bacterium]|nr:DUF4286 family protein [Bacteroidales bacterium]
MSKYILNTSFHLTKNVKDEFIKWAKETYIPAALETGFLSSPVFTKILAEIEPGTESYAIHFKMDDLKKAAEWHDTIAAELKNAIHNKTNKQVLFFTTYMEEI